MKKWFIFGFILSVFLSANTQNIYLSAADQLPSDVIKLDISTSFFNTSYYNVARYKKLNHLIFTNSIEKPLSESIFSFFNAEQIHTLEFDNISLADFNYILMMLKKVKAINTLIIRKTKIETIPMLLITTKGVRTLIVNNCKTLNPNALNPVFTERTFLNTLRITNCEIYSLEKVFPRNGFSVIDLRNNHLSYAGIKLSYIKTLDSVFLSGNNIPNAMEDLMNFNSKELKYIETDSISVLANTKLREARKNIHWEFVPKPSASDKLTKKVFGQFVVNSSKYKIYSTAYLQYDRLFTNAQFFVNLDTSSLDEVFWDTLNKLSRQIPLALNKNIFRLYKEKNIIRKHITFGFNKDRKGLNFSYYSYSKSNFYKSHPEMSIYKKYHWITVKPMNSKDFRTFSRRNFVDLRLIYDDIGKSYTLYLKKFDGTIIALKVFPAKGKGKKNIKNNSEKYASDYAKYLASLTKKNRKHDRDIIRNKKRVYVSIERAKRNAWNNLRSYMSPIEREMTNEEWMNYYFQLVKYEEKALLAAYPEGVFLERKLQKMGFTYEGINMDTVGLTLISVYFTDENNANIPVSKLVLLNKSRMTYKIVYVGSFFSSIDLSIYRDDDLSIIVFMPDKSVGLITMDDIIPSIQNSINNRIHSQIVGSELISIGQVLKVFDL